MQGFNEAQDVRTTQNYAVDGGIIPAGTVVDSHMIFFNTQGLTVGIHREVVWTFDQPIIGVMTESNGSAEAISSFELGAPGTNYTAPVTGCGKAAPFRNRALEGQSLCDPDASGAAIDGYVVNGSEIKVCMFVTEPGDWIRVVTRGAVSVDIDVKPGVEPNCFNINGHGVIPVAVLGSADLNIFDIDPATLEFGGLSVRIRGNTRPQCSPQDVNGDAYLDLVCQFVDDSAQWTAGETMATLDGRLNDGTAITGEGSICVVP